MPDGGDGGEHAVRRPSGANPWLVKFSPWKAVSEERDDDQQDDRELPPHQRVVDPREPADAEVVDDDEQRHQHHRGAVAERGQRVDRLRR